MDDRLFILSLPKGVLDKHAVAMPVSKDEVPMCYYILDGKSKRSRSMSITFTTRHPFIRHEEHIVSSDLRRNLKVLIPLLSEDQVELWQSDFLGNVCQIPIRLSIDDDYSFIAITDYRQLRRLSEDDVKRVMVRDESSVNFLDEQKTIIRANIAKRDVFFEPPTKLIRDLVKQLEIPITDPDMVSTVNVFSGKGIVKFHKDMKELIKAGDYRNIKLPVYIIGLPVNVLNYSQLTRIDKHLLFSVDQLETLTLIDEILKNN